MLILEGMAMGKQKPFDQLTVIVPTLNEAGSIAKVCEEILRYCPGSDVIVADDDSQDGTADIVRSLSRKGLAVRLLARQGKQGLTASVLDALELVERPIVAVIDGDLQHPPEKLPELVKRLADADVVVGVRSDVAGTWKLHRRLMSRTAHVLGNLRLSLGKKRCSDPLSGFFAVRTELVRRCVAKARWRFSPRGYKVLFDLLKCLPKQTRIAELPYTFNLRIRGQSKIGIQHVIAFVRSLIT